MSSKNFPPGNPAPNTGSDREKELEMRVAELEDKLAKLQSFTEEYRGLPSFTAKELVPGARTGLRAVLMADRCVDWRLGFILPLSDSPKDFWSNLGKDESE